MRSEAEVRKYRDDLRRMQDYVGPAHADAEGMDLGRAIIDVLTWALNEPSVADEWARKAAAITARMPGEP